MKLVFSRCACAKLKIFLYEEKFLKWTPAFPFTKSHLDTKWDPRETIKKKRIS